MVDSARERNRERERLLRRGDRDLEPVAIEGEGEAKWTHKDWSDLRPRLPEVVFVDVEVR